jgi:hypothetical protein
MFVEVAAIEMGAEPSTVAALRAGYRPQIDAQAPSAAKVEL